MFGNKVIITLLCRLTVQIHIPVIDCGKYSLGAQNNDVAKFRVSFKSLAEFSRGDTIYFAWGFGNNRSSRFLSSKRKGKICNELTGKLQSDNMLVAVIAVCHIFQCAGLNITEVSGDAAGIEESLAPVIMAQNTLTQA